MKLGEGGEAFFVFETSDNVPEAMQTSPLVSPASSPPLAPEGLRREGSNLSEPDFLDLDITSRSRAGTFAGSPSEESPRRPSHLGESCPVILHAMC